MAAVHGQLDQLQSNSWNYAAFENEKKASWCWINWSNWFPSREETACLWHRITNHTRFRFHQPIYPSIHPMQRWWETTCSLCSVTSKSFKINVTDGLHLSLQILHPFVSFENKMTNMIGLAQVAKLFFGSMHHASTCIYACQEVSNSDIIFVLPHSCMRYTRNCYGVGLLALTGNEASSLPNQGLHIYVYDMAG